MSKSGTILTIMDGHGIAPPGPGNAIYLADTPNLDRLYDRYPTSRIHASGEYVGLPDGQMGNSEVGHLNLGAGRVVYQDITRIDKSIREGTFQTNPILTKAIRIASDRGSRIHLMGLVSDGGVHSHLRHLIALLKLIHASGHHAVTVHAFMDGRDTPPDSGKGYIRELLQSIREIGVGEIGTIVGRYYAMDRDNRWDRIEKAYNALVHGKGSSHADGVSAMETAYGEGETDEFITPRVIENTHRIQDGDVLLFFNFRADRMRQICHTFLDREFDHFKREPMRFPSVVTFTEYEEGLPVNIAFPRETMTGLYGECISQAGLKQLRIAETEKYAHVTFFFNGGEEQQFEGEERILIPSPKVATYDLQPEMSAVEVTDKVVEAIRSGRFDTIILNYANCDMVGHTGVLEAAVKAVETVDTCVGRVADAVLEAEWDMLLTADHGNAEQMREPDGGPFTAHSTNPVPLCLISERFRDASLDEGSLRDIAPTLLWLMNLKQPEEMTGKCLIKR